MKLEEVRTLKDELLTRWEAEEIVGPKNAPDAPWHQPPWLNRMRRGDFYTDYQEAE